LIRLQKEAKIAPTSILEPIMANLSIKDVPEAWTEVLRQRAARNHRSLQGELMAMVEVMVQGVPDAVNLAAASNPTRINGKINPQTKTHLATTGKGTVVGYDRRGQAIVQRGWKSLDEVLAAMRAKFPDPVDQGPNSLEILRAEREARDEQLNRGR
jgi:plasmid stability protein